jgi:hypothetical protein
MGVVWSGLVWSGLGRVCSAAQHPLEDYCPLTSLFGGKKSRVTEGVDFGGEGPQKKKDDSPMTQTSNRNG